MLTQFSLPVALTIAGSDSGGGAGIQADLLTFAALHVHGTSAITCLTAQNPRSVSNVHAVPPEFVKAQLDQVASYFSIKALKTGMLFNVGIIHAVADFVESHPDILAVVDPVMVASSGATLLEANAVDAYRERLLPLSHVFTPNLDEVSVLLGRSVESVHALKDAGCELSEMYRTNVLLKGGHITGNKLMDTLVLKNGEIHNIHSTRIHGVDTHGSGCTLSSAITAELAKGLDLISAFEVAHRYLLTGIQSRIQIGESAFINHFPVVE